MYSLNKNFDEDPFLNVSIEIQNFLNKDDIKIINEYGTKNSLFKVSAVTTKHEENIESSPSFILYDNKPENDYRNSSVIWINNTKQSEIQNVYKKICSQIIDLNNNIVKYDLTDIESLQYTIYEEGQFYKKHIDMSNKLQPGDIQRKLSFSVQLSDPMEYEGGDLIIYDTEKGTQASKIQGSATFFSSLILHEVTPVTKGKRLALVGWVWGPRFR